MPVIIAALGAVKKGLDQSRQMLTGHRSAIELQKVTLMSTAQSIRLVLGENASICCSELDFPGDCHLITDR